MKRNDNIGFMSDKQNEENKRQLQKLLREYDSNKGMAGFVCSQAVELMSKSEQDRIISGFCNKENIKVLDTAAKKFSFIKDHDFVESEKEKVDNAILILESLVKNFSDYMSEEISRQELRTQVRNLLGRPLPEDEEGLINSFSTLIDTLIFLSQEPIQTKDNWDTMVDSVQMHEALNRIVAVLSRLEICLEKKYSPAMKETSDVAAEKIVVLEKFFKGDLEEALLYASFDDVAKVLKKLWVEEST